MLLSSLKSIQSASAALTVLALILLVPELWPQENSSRRTSERNPLVRVNIIRTTRDTGPGETVDFNGRRITNYHPKIIHLYPSTGVVIDDKRHILTFLGYRWVDVQGEPRRIDVVTCEGERFPARMIGIDQSNGVAVVRCEGGNLEKTPLCLRCEIRDGATVVAPLSESSAPTQFQSAQIISVGSAGENAQGGWIVRVNRKLSGIGEPLLDQKLRVLGFIANEGPSPQDPAGMQTVIFPMAQLMISAQKILSVGGDIHTGWLGVYLDYSAPLSNSGVVIDRLAPDSPASKAGLAPQDVLLKWRGTRIRDARQFIRLVKETQPGTKVNLEILRHGKPVVVSPVIETRRASETPETFILNFPEEIPGSQRRP